jgi:hypothetical protein
MDVSLNPPTPCFVMGTRMTNHGPSPTARNKNDLQVRHPELVGRRDVPHPFDEEPRYLMVDEKDGESLLANHT